MTSTIKERPILFSGPMVRAILEGRKTVTRRLVKGGQIPKLNENEPEPFLRWTAIGQKDPRWGFIVSGETEEECASELGTMGVCPYGRRGDRLWVRETYGDAGCRLTYRADLDDGAHCQVKKWTPAIHMFRKDSRILLEITAVRVERLQDISDDQALAEGVEVWARDADPVLRQEYADDPKLAFVGLWTAVNGLGSYNANPWVWVIKYKRVQP